MGRIVWIPTYRKQSPSPNPPGVTPKQKSRWCGYSSHDGYCWYGRYGDYYGDYGGYVGYGYYPGLFSYAEQRYPYV